MKTKKTGGPARTGSSAADRGDSAPTLQPPRWPMASLFLLAVVVGAVLVNDYGMSWDEPFNVRYASVALDAFLDVPHFHQVHPAGPTGPGFFMLAEIGARIFHAILPFWRLFEARHYVYFLTFIAGAWGLYTIIRRVASPAASAFASLVYVLQPLFWGHAFMNPKDTPFLSMFVLAVAAGMQMVDAYPSVSGEGKAGESSGSSGHSWLSPLTADWRGSSRLRRPLVMAGVLGFILLVLDLLVFHAVLLPIGLRLLRSILIGHQPPWLDSAVARIAANFEQVSVADYLWKATRIYLRLRWLAVGLAGALAVLSLRRGFPRTWRKLGGSSGWKHVVVAALLLGLASSMRIVGAFAGLLVIVYARPAWTRKHIVHLVGYAGLSMAVGLCLRPYFWGDPIARFMDSVRGVGEFSWQGVVLYGGETYHVWELPASYSPAILLQHLTIPALVLAVIGVYAVWRRAGRRSISGRVGRTLAVWLVVPLVIGELVGLAAYDEFRQLMFLLPPIFVLVGPAYDEVIDRIPGRWIGPGLFAISLLPAIVAIVNLHPYEYIYRNAAAGGVRSRFRVSEMDYWCTSVREGIEYVNQVAAPGSSVVVIGQPEAAAPILRDDLRLVFRGSSGASTPDYAVICARGNADQTVRIGGHTVLEVARQGAVLTVVREEE